MHGQAEQQAPDPHAPRSCCPQAAAVDPQDCSLPSARVTTQMPEGTEPKDIQGELTPNWWLLKKMDIDLESHFISKDLNIR